MWPAFSAATRWVPCADAATALQCVSKVLVWFHVAPESVDKYKCPNALEPPPAAMIVLASAEQATSTQLVSGAELCVQFNPEFVEIEIEPLPEPFPSLAAMSFVPSAEEAREVNA